MKKWGKSVTREDIKNATYEELIALINQWNSEDKNHCLEDIYPADYNKSEVEELRLMIWDEGFEFGCPCGAGDDYDFSGDEIRYTGYINCCSPKTIPTKDWK